MSELFALGPLIVIAVVVIAIFLVLGIFYIVQRQAEKSVRSPEYWNEEPDGRKYPTGWGEGPTVSEPAEGYPDRPQDPPQDPPRDGPREGRDPGDEGDVPDR